MLQSRSSELEMADNCVLQRFILAEALKYSSVDVGILVGLIKDAEIRPKWNRMALPKGIQTARLRYAYTSPCIGISSQTFCHN